MKKSLSVVALVATMMLLLAPGARAGDFQLVNGDPRLFPPAVAVGAATTGAYFAIRNQGGPVRFSQGGAFGLTTVGCMALTPIDPESRQQYNIGSAVRGVLVQGVKSTSDAGDKGLRIATVGRNIMAIASGK